MKFKRIAQWGGGFLAALVGLGIGYFTLIIDGSGKPFCHKQFHLTFINWQTENGMVWNSPQTTFPNVNGASKDSLETLHDQIGGHMDWFKGYKYVPGLKVGDPGDLVLMYFDRPTRWLWHGVPQTIFKEKAWIVIPVDFTMGSRPIKPNQGELNERLSNQEFRSRLQRTLDFLRTNNRPNWQTVVAEHKQFLNSIDQEKK